MRNLLAILSLVTFFIACDSNRKFDEYQTIDGGVWDQDSIYKFQFQVDDTISQNNLFINLRNNKDYEFSNIFLITEMRFPDGYKVVDTLEYEMTDHLGNFLGAGYTDLKQNKLFYKENVRFNQSGIYNFSIEQAMRKGNQIQGLKSLQGITDVGLRIEAVK